MIMSCMNCTFAGECGGSVAFVEEGSVRVGWPGAPGWTTTGDSRLVCCAETDNGNEHESATAAKNVTLFISRFGLACIGKDFICPKWSILKNFTLSQTGSSLTPPPTPHYPLNLSHPTSRDFV